MPRSLVWVFLLFLLVNGQRSSLVACGQVVFPFDCHKDSSYQNACEFIAVLLAVLALAQLGVRDVSIRLCGDSITSLSGGTDGHFTGHLYRRASWFTFWPALYSTSLLGSLCISPESRTSDVELSLARPPPLLHMELTTDS